MFEWANSESWIWAWVLAELVSLLAHPHLQQQGDLSSTALPKPSNAPISRRLGQLSYAHTLWDSSPVPTHPESAALWFPVKVQGPLSQVLQPVRS